LRVGRLIAPSTKSATEYGSALGLSRSVPDEFRELAEKDL